MYVLVKKILRGRTFCHDVCDLIVLSCYTFLWIVLLNSIATAESSSPGSQPIKDIEITGLYSISNEELLNLLNIKQGIPLDIASISTGIKRAFLKGIFEDLIIETADTENTHIKILVKEKEIIDAIKISGNDHFAQGFIKKQLSFSLDDRVIIERLRESVKQIKSAMSKRGFPASEVSYEIKPGERNKATVLIIVKEGDPEIIRSIEIAERGDEMKSSLKFKEGDIYNETDVARFVENTRKNFTKKGYVMTSLTYIFKNGTLSFTFEKGKKLTVSFEGNSALSSGVLTKELIFKEINDFSDDLIDEAIMRMITVYHQKGYAFAKIVPHVKTV
ncbi:MAG: POTRA domain-containing protein, partial [Dissulfurispiraceae bacterium]